MASSIQEDSAADLALSASATPQEHMQHLRWANSKE